MISTYKCYIILYIPKNGKTIVVQIERQIILNEPSLIFEFAHQRFVMFFMVFRTKYNMIMSTCATVSSKEFLFNFFLF